jgi:hypothetical protein
LRFKKSWTQKRFFALQFGHTVSLTTAIAPRSPRYKTMQSASFVLFIGSTPYLRVGCGSTIYQPLRGPDFYHRRFSEDRPELNDHRFDLTAFRALESPQVIARLVGLYACETDLRSAILTSRANDCIRFRCSGLVCCHVQLTLGTFAMRRAVPGSGQRSPLSVPVGS